ncbi:MAG: hypothetical protein JWQ36_2473 [Enterovirga sp.]|jgi:hypothetical protein|nr:hypothetical protein [Enterovirga sp.]
MLMKGKSIRIASAKSKNDVSAAENLALAAFNRLIAEPERLGGFLAATGLQPDTIRDAAGQPGFYGAILDYIASDEQLIVGIAGELGINPAEIAAARVRLSPEAWFEE